VLVEHRDFHGVQVRHYQIVPAPTLHGSLGAP
jgi:hypothetical protein